MLSSSFYKELIETPNLTCKEYVDKVYMDSYDTVLTFVTKRVFDFEHITQEDIVDEVNMHMVEYLSKKFGTKAMYQRYGTLILHIEKIIIERLCRLNEKRANSDELISYDTIVDILPESSVHDGNVDKMIDKLTRVLFRCGNGQKGKLTDLQRCVVFDRLGIIDGVEKAYGEIAKNYGVTGSNVRVIYLHGIHNIQKEMRELEAEDDALIEDF